MTSERPSTHADIPKDATGRPDDRFDGTDSGPDGWDTPYPPADTDTAEGSTASAAPHPDRPSSRGDGVPAVEERTPSIQVDGTAYETDGPDEPADTPQR